MTDQELTGHSLFPLNFLTNQALEREVMSFHDAPFYKAQCGHKTMAECGAFRKEKKKSCKHLCLNSWKGMRLGKPCLQIRIPSKTPLHLSWSKTRCGASLPAWRKVDKQQQQRRNKSCQAQCQLSFLLLSIRRPCLTLFSWLGIMQRRKLGLVFLSVAISLVRDSL